MLTSLIIPFFMEDVTGIISLYEVIAMQKFNCTYLYCAQIFPSPVTYKQSQSYSTLPPKSIFYICSSTHRADRFAPQSTAFRHTGTKPPCHKQARGQSRRLNKASDQQRGLVWESPCQNLELLEMHLYILWQFPSHD